MSLTKQSYPYREERRLNGITLLLEGSDRIHGRVVRLTDVVATLSITNNATTTASYCNEPLPLPRSTANGSPCLGFKDTFSLSSLSIATILTPLVPSHTQNQPRLQQNVLLSIIRKIFGKILPSSLHSLTVLPPDQLTPPHTASEPTPRPSSACTAHGKSPSRTQTVRPAG